MRLGYFTMPLHPSARNYTEVLKEDREAIDREKERVRFTLAPAPTEESETSTPIRAPRRRV